MWLPSPGDAAILSTLHRRCDGSGFPQLDRPAEPNAPPCRPLLRRAAGGARLVGTASALAVLLGSASALAAPPPPAEDMSRLEARLLRPASGTGTEVQEPKPFRIHPEPARRQRPVAAWRECELDALLAQTGAAFLDRIQNMDWDCISALFSEAPATLRYPLLSEANMVAVATAIAGIAEVYDGANALQLAKLFYYLRAGTFAQYYDLAMPRWSETPYQAFIAAIDALVANALFLEDEGNDHGTLLAVVFTFMDAPNRRGRYLSTTGTWLARWNESRAQHWGQRNAAADAFVLVFHCSGECPEATEDLALVAALRRFALGDWMVDTRAEVLAASASRELARLLQHADAPIGDAVRAGTEAILARYESLGEGAAIWVAAALMVTIFDDCASFGICAELEGLEGAVLSVNHQCAPGVVVRGQVLTPAQLDTACEQLAAQAAIFHRRLATDPRQPLEGDVPVRYEAVAFADYDNYQAYSPLFFGNPTDNGGIYLEGDPSRPGNVSRHLGHVADWLDSRPIWNLEHEYVHHLDAHFNLLGQFHEHISFDTVWWAEGLAEYLSLKDDNERAVALGRSGALPLDTVFDTSYASSVDRVYRWSYLAVRFLFERHPEVVERLLVRYRVGDFAGARDYVDGTADADYDSEWRQWLQAVEALPYLDLAAVPRLEDRVLSDSGESTTLALARMFALGEREVTVRAVSSNPRVATVRVAGSRISLVAVAAGDATITIIVGDAWGNAVRRFTVTVGAECPPWECRSFVRGWRAALGAAP